MEQAQDDDKLTTIDDYIASFPKAVQVRLEAIRQVIRDEAPGAEETIKYHMPTYVLHGNLVYFAAWKEHIALYPITADMEATIIELGGYKTSGKGTVQFPHDQPLPLDLVRRIVAMRVAENRTG